MPWKAACVRNTYSWTSRAAFFSQRSSSGNTCGSGPPHRAGQHQLGVAEPLDFVSKGGGFLEIEIRRGRAHFLLLRRQIGVELLLVVESLGSVGRRGRRQI